MATVRHHHGPRSERGTRREQGSIIVLMTLLLSVLLVLATLVIDGGQAYPQRRKAQNAADEASLAGARALDRTVITVPPTGTAAAVNATVQSVVEDNGADLEECTIIQGDGDEIGPCSSDVAVTDPDAAGVHVKASETRPTSFGDIVEQDSITARASAAATIQTLSKTGSPFIICGNPKAPDSSDAPELLKTNPAGNTIYNSDGSASIDVAKARSQGVFPIQGEGKNKTPGCGAHADFKGKKEKGQSPLAVPSAIPSENGDGFDHDIFATVVGTTPCPTSGPLLNCDVLLPISDGAVAAKSRILNVVAWGVFHVTGDGKGNPKYSAIFVGLPSYATGGETSDGTPTGTEARVIRLIR